MTIAVDFDGTIVERALICSTKVSEKSDMVKS